MSSWWNRRDPDLDEESSAHFRIAIAERMARGESAAEAERDAHRSAARTAV
jgi:hypothetical protein